MKRWNRLPKDEFSQAESRGSMLLASMMTVSFGVLIFLGMVTSTLSEKVSTQQIVQQAQALQLAHSGVEYALWEINYHGAAYTGTGWAVPVGNTHTYTQDTDSPPDGVPNITVTVTDPNDGTTPITISSQGKSATTGVGRTVQVTVPPRAAAAAPAPGIFNQILYTAQSNIHLDASNGEIVLDGYDSSAGAYDANSDGIADSPLPAGQVVLMSDYGPFRKISTFAGDHLASAVVLEGNITTNAKVVFRKKGAAELIPPGYSYLDGSLDNGFYNKVTSPGSFTGSVEIADRDNTNVPAVLYTPVAGPDVDPAVDYPVIPSYYLWGENGSDAYWSIDPTAGEMMVVCPGDTVKTTELDVKNITLVVGCTTDGTAYDCSNPDDKFYTIYGAPFSDPDYGQPGGRCTGDLTRPVVISAGTGDTYSKGAYALRTQGSTGSIRVYNPLTIYYNYSGTSGGFDLGGGGINNQVKRTNNVIDPSKVTIYGGASESAVSYASTISTTQAFYGGIFDPKADLSFGNTATLNLFGSVNVRQIWTDKSVKIHWDKGLQTGGSGGGEGGGGGGSTCDPTASNCHPNPGSWSVQNN